MATPDEMIEKIDAILYAPTSYWWSQLIGDYDRMVNYERGDK